MENQGISNDLPNPDDVDGVSAGPVAANIAAKIFEDPPNINERHSPLPLLEKDHPQEQGMDSMENEGNSKTRNLAQRRRKTREIRCEASTIPKTSKLIPFRTQTNATVLFTY